MSETKIALSSLALDLKRVALGYWKGSDETAGRFVEEALERKKELDKVEVKPYLRQLLDQLPQVVAQEDKKRLAEDALMYSTRFQNYALRIK